MKTKLMLAALACCVAGMASAADPVETRAYYSTNANGAVGVPATITIDGKLTDWTEAMQIATCGANDVCTTFNGSHENCVIDLYALYAAWDDKNVYIAWQCVNTGDTWARPGDGPLTDGGRIGDVPMIVALSIDPSKPGMTGKLENGNCIWRDNASSGVTFGSHVDRILYMSAKSAQGSPAIFKAVNDKGDTNYGAGCTTFANCGIIYKHIEGGFLPSHLWRQNTHADWADVGVLVSDPSIVQNIYDPECYDNLMAGPVAGLKAHNHLYDTFYELAIPYTALGITREWLEANGMGVRVIGSRGESGIDCVPHDPSMVDAVLEPYGKDGSTSHEKDDFDHITYGLADIAKLRDVTSITPPPTPTPGDDPKDPGDDPNNPGTTPTDPAPQTGNYNVYLKADATNWSAVNVYMWDAGNGNKEYCGKWPGTAATKVSVAGKSYWHYALNTTDALITPMVIFNGSGGQSKDLAFVNNGVYTLDGHTGEVITDPSAVQFTLTDKSVSVSGRTVSAAGRIEVYNMMGVAVCAGIDRVELPAPGLYIVRTASESLRVIVK